MNGAERAAAARTAGATVDHLNDTVAEVSSAVRRHVRRGLRFLGPFGTPVMDVVDQHHDVVHGAVGAGAKLLSEAAAEALRVTGKDREPVAQTPKGRTLLAGLNAAFGDRLPPEFAGAMQLTVAPDATHHSTVAVLVHGLGGHDQQWGHDYLSTLRGADITPVVAHYATGRSITDNAADFDAAMDELIAAWPCDVTRIILVGHSMGGLITGAAVAAGSPWSARVSDLVTLGSPFAGAPLERFARTTLRLGAQMSDVARPIIAIGDRRSVGIKDLGDGIDLTIPDHVRHHTVVASLGPQPNHPTSLILGDGIVPQDSARGHRVTGGTRTVIEVNAAGHLQLLDDPRVTTLLEHVVALDPPA